MFFHDREPRPCRKIAAVRPAHPRSAEENNNPSAPYFSVPYPCASSAEIEYPVSRISEGARRSACRWDSIKTPGLRLLSQKSAGYRKQAPAEPCSRDRSLKRRKKFPA